jgi:MarR-like DNA-binding transcriptional regulator SgrR of sgrS sRNA
MLQGPVDNTVSSLVFSSLLKYDEENRLVGDLARQWSVDDSGLEYTVLLREDILWHDGVFSQPKTLNILMT